MTRQVLVILRGLFLLKKKLSMTPKKHVARFTKRHKLRRNLGKASGRTAKLNACFVKHTVETKIFVLMI